MKHLTSCNNNVDAENLMARLQEMGIGCESREEGLNKIYLGGTVPVEVLVEDNEFDRAAEILKKYEKEQKDFLPWCPECGSDQITVRRVSEKHGPVAEMLLMCTIIVLCIAASFIKIRFISVALGGVIGLWCWQRPRNRDVYTCSKCGREFTR